MLKQAKRIYKTTSLSKAIAIGMTPVLRLILTAICLLLPQSLLAQDAVISKTTSNLPVVDSAKLNTNINVPWSQAVRISDPFEGEFIAIFDKNYFYQYFLNTYTKVDVLSLWRQDSIQMILALTPRDCLTGTGFYGGSLGSCDLANETQNITKLYIKVKDQVFELEGQNSVFQVSDQLATALRNSPSENINIRLITATGVSIDSEIGKGTVEAWKMIY